MPPLVSFHEIKLVSGVFFYVDDIVQILFAVGSVENNKLNVVCPYTGNFVVLLNRKRKRGIITVNTVFCILVVCMFCSFPSTICRNLYDLAKIPDCLVFLLLKLWVYL